MKSLEKVTNMVGLFAAYLASSAACTTPLTVRPDEGLRAQYVSYGGQYFTLDDFLTSERKIELVDQMLAQNDAVARDNPEWQQIRRIIVGEDGTVRYGLVSVQLMEGATVFGLPTVALTRKTEDGESLPYTVVEFVPNYATGHDAWNLARLETVRGYSNVRQIDARLRKAKIEDKLRRGQLGQQGGSR